MDEKQFYEILRFAIEKEMGTHNLSMMCRQAAKYSGGKELFAELAEEEHPGWVEVLPTQCSKRRRQRLRSYF